MGRMSSEVITLPDGQNCSTPFSVTLPHPHPILTCWRCLSCLCVGPGFLGLCKLFGVEAVICCVPVMWRTMRTRSTTAYIRSNNASLHWALLCGGPKWFCSCKSKMWGFLSYGRSSLKILFFQKSWDKAGYFFRVSENSVSCSLKEEGYSLKSLYSVEEQREKSSYYFQVKS